MTRSSLDRDPPSQAAVSVRHTPRGGAIVEGGLKARLAFFEQFRAGDEDLIA